MKNKKILIRGLSLAIVGVSCLAIGSKPTYKTIDNSNLDERMAVYIKNETGNYEKSNSIPTTGYILNEEKSTCNNNAKPTWNRNNKSLKISNLSNDNTSCYLYFDEETEIVNTVLGNLTVNRYIPDFSQIATTDEGIFKAEDNDGTSYYWRGAATTNYLKFGGYCWRIVRINGDGTIRLIYDGESCHQNGEATTDSIAVQNVAYNEKYDQSNYVGWTYEGTLQRPTNNLIGVSSNVKTQLESWYSNNITGTNAEKVADGKFCNDKDVGAPASGWTGMWSTIWSINGTSFAFAGVDRLWNKYQPTLLCSLGDIYTLKIGLITADEAEFGGGKDEENTSYYLCNGQAYWTMSPNDWNSAGNAYMFPVYYNGGLGSINVDNNFGLGLRPVINLRSDITISSGDGTIDNPYVVEGA